MAAPTNPGILPTTPGLFVFQGKVSDTQGKGIPGLVVRVMGENISDPPISDSDLIVGLPGLTDINGNYAVGIKQTDLGFLPEGHSGKLQISIYRPDSLDLVRYKKSRILDKNREINIENVDFKINENPFEDQRLDKTNSVQQILSQGGYFSDLIQAHLKDAIYNKILELGQINHPLLIEYIKGAYLEFDPLTVSQTTYKALITSLIPSGVTELETIIETIEDTIDRLDNFFIDDTLQLDSSLEDSNLLSNFFQKELPYIQPDIDQPDLIFLKEFSLLNLSKTEIDYWKTEKLQLNTITRLSLLEINDLNLNQLNFSEERIGIILLLKEFSELFGYNKQLIEASLAARPDYQLINDFRTEGKRFWKEEVLHPAISNGYSLLSNETDDEAAERLYRIINQKEPGKTLIELIKKDLGTFNSFSSDVDFLKSGINYSQASESRSSYNSRTNISIFKTIQTGSEGTLELENKIRAVEKTSNRFRKLGVFKDIKTGMENNDNNAMQSITKAKNNLERTLSLLNDENNYSIIDNIANNNSFSVDWTSSDNIQNVNQRSDFRKNAKNQIIHFGKILKISNNDPELSIQVIDGGYESVYEISQEDPDSLMRETGITSREKAEEIINASKAEVAAYAHTFANVQVEVYGHTPYATNSISRRDVQEQLESIEGYEEIFGSATLCEVDDCRSVLSPAAYFVDLLNIIKRNVSLRIFFKPSSPTGSPFKIITKNSDGPYTISTFNYSFSENISSDNPENYGTTGNKLNLIERRNDLINLELNCDSTKSLLPYAELTSEILIYELNKYDALSSLEFNETPFLPGTSKFLYSEEILTNKALLGIRGPKSLNYSLVRKLSEPLNINFSTDISLLESDKITQAAFNLGLDKISVSFLVDNNFFSSDVILANNLEVDNIIKNGIYRTDDPDELHIKTNYLKESLQIDPNDFNYILNLWTTSDNFFTSMGAVNSDYIRSGTPENPFESESTNTLRFTGNDRYLKANHFVNQIVKILKIADLRITSIAGLVKLISAKSSDGTYQYKKFITGTNSYYVINFEGLMPILGRLKAIKDKLNLSDDQLELFWKDLKFSNGSDVAQNFNYLTTFVDINRVLSGPSGGNYSMPEGSSYRTIACQQLGIEFEELIPVLNLITPSTDTLSIANLTAPLSVWEKRFSRILRIMILSKFLGINTIELRNGLALLEMEWIFKETIEENLYEILGGILKIIKDLPKIKNSPITGPEFGFIQNGIEDINNGIVYKIGVSSYVKNLLKNTYKIYNIPNTGVVTSMDLEKIYAQELEAKKRLKTQILQDLQISEVQFSFLGQWLFPNSEGNPEDDFGMFDCLNGALVGVGEEAVIASAARVAVNQVPDILAPNTQLEIPITANDPGGDLYFNQSVLGNRPLGTIGELQSAIENEFSYYAPDQVIDYLSSVSGNDGIKVVEGLPSETENTTDRANQVTLRENEAKRTPFIRIRENNRDIEGPNYFVVAPNKINKVAVLIALYRAAEFELTELLKKIERGLFYFQKLQINLDEMGVLFQNKLKLGIDLPNDEDGFKGLLDPKTLNRISNLIVLLGQNKSAALMRQLLNSKPVVTSSSLKLSASNPYTFWNNIQDGISRITGCHPNLAGQCIQETGKRFVIERPAGITTKSALEAYLIKNHIPILEDTLTLVMQCKAYNTDLLGLKRLVNNGSFTGENFGESATEAVINTLTDVKKFLGRKMESQEKADELFSKAKDNLMIENRDFLANMLMCLDPDVFQTKRDIYYYLLMDPEMGPEVMTSRIVAGYNSLQLYIHRCLLNLENSKVKTLSGSDSAGEYYVGAVLTDKFREEWIWRRNYRVWEANRKVFLYPENYLEPQLRPGKSAQFKEMEEALLSTDLTRERAEEVFSQYLSKIEDLFEMRHVGAYWEQETKTYFFIGKTKTFPSQYYYRCFKPLQNSFEPWIKIEGELSGDFVSAIRFKKRIWFFWMQSTLVEGSAMDQGRSYQKEQVIKKLCWTNVDEKGNWSKTKRQDIYKFEYNWYTDNSPTNNAGKYGTIKLLTAAPPNGEFIHNNYWQWPWDHEPRSFWYDPFYLNKIKDFNHKIVEVYPSINQSSLLVSFSCIFDPYMMNNNFGKSFKYSITNDIFIDDSINKFALNSDQILQFRHRIHKINFDISFSTLKIHPDSGDLPFLLERTTPGLLENVYSEHIQNAYTAVFGSNNLNNDKKQQIMYLAAILQKNDNIFFNIPDNFYNTNPSYFSPLLTLSSELWKLIEDNFDIFHNSVRKFYTGSFSQVPEKFRNSFFPVNGFHLDRPSFLNFNTNTQYQILTRGRGATIDIYLNTANITSWDFNQFQNRVDLSDLPTGVSDFFTANNNNYFAFQTPFFDLIDPSGISFENHILKFENLELPRWLGSGYNMNFPAFVNYKPMIWSMYSPGGSESFNQIYAQFGRSLFGYPLLQSYPGQPVNDLYNMGSAFDIDPGIPKPEMGYWSYLVGRKSQDTILHLHGEEYLLANLSSNISAFGPTPFFNCLFKISTPLEVIEDGSSPRLKLGDKFFNIGIEKGFSFEFQNKFFVPISPSTAIKTIIDSPATNVSGTTADDQNKEITLGNHHVSGQTPLPNRKLNIHTKLLLKSSSSSRQKSPFFYPTTSFYMEEAFFHTPFLIADHFNSMGKYKEAKWWYERIFDPTAKEGGAGASLIPSNELSGHKAWQYLPFRVKTVQSILGGLTNPAAIEAYRSDPFNPYAIARLRLTAFQKAIVMRYIDNLLDWGDALFSQDTNESVNEALLLYILASDLLGAKPEKGRACDLANQETTYGEITPFLPNPVTGQDGATTEYDFKTTMGGDSSGSNDSIDYGFFYKSGEKQVFGIPRNPQFTSNWDRVEDRLYKIRNSMNLSGAKRRLALFAPPIDPMMLVRMRGAGLSLEEILDGGKNLSPYRFTYLMDKAKQFAQTVQSFGAALLSALEKKDIEELNLLRQTHEMNIQSLTRQVKESQISEADYQHLALIEQRVNAENRKNYYKELISKGLSGWEITQRVSQHLSTGFGIAQSIVGSITTGVAPLPTALVPWGVIIGGDQAYRTMKSAASTLGMISQNLSQIAHSASIEGTWHRRMQEWKHQESLADQEIKQIKMQIEAAAIRKQLAEKDLTIFNKQVENSKEIDTFYKEKFSGYRLYNYLARELNKLYTESYNLALRMANRAKAALDFEIAFEAPFQIKTNLWDGNQMGFLAGEKLLIELQKMEEYFIRENARKLEITQHISMAQWDPEALVSLQQTGAGQISLPKLALYLHYPNVKNRVVKSISFSIPCVTGPNGNVPALVSASSGTRGIPISKVALSHGQNDSGMFEKNLRDERFLPFEGMALDASSPNPSNWTNEKIGFSLSFPNGSGLAKVPPVFDYSTISDVVFHIQYQADAVDTPTFTMPKPKNIPLIISIKESFPETFASLMDSITSPSEITILSDMLPAPIRLLPGTKKIVKGNLFGVPKVANATLETLKAGLSHTPSVGTTVSSNSNLTSTSGIAGTFSGISSIPIQGQKLYLRTEGTGFERVEDLILVLIVDVE